MNCYTKVGKNACIVDVCLCLVPGANSIMAQFDNINPYHWPGWFIVALALFYIGITLIVFREIRPPPKLKRPKGSVSCHCLTRIKLSTQLQSDWKMQFTVSSIYTCSLDHCKNVKVISTLAGLPQLNIVRGFYNSPHNECFISVIKTLPLIKIS